jgi:hypothetical protein
MSESQLKNVNAWVPIAYCVRMVQLDLDDYTNTQYEKLLQYAIRGYEKLHFTTMNSVKVAYLEMSDTNSVKLPSDYVDYYKIGMVVNGVVWNLGLNNEIALPRDQECGNDIRDISSGGSPSFGYYYTDHYQDGAYVGGMFGVGGGFRQSYFRIDEARGQVLFTSTVPRNEIVIEYKSSGISAQTMVPRPAIDVLVAYIHWRRLKSRNRDSERREAEREWKEELSEFRAFTFAFKPKEYLDMLHEEQLQTPKR